MSERVELWLIAGGFFALTLLHAFAAVYLFEID